MISAGSGRPGTAFKDMDSTGGTGRGDGNRPGLLHLEIGWPHHQRSISRCRTALVVTHEDVRARERSATRAHLQHHTIIENAVGIMVKFRFRYRLINQAGSGIGIDQSVLENPPRGVSIGHGRARRARPPGAGV